MNYGGRFYVILVSYREESRHQEQEAWIPEWPMEVKEVKGEVSSVSR